MKNPFKRFQKNKVAIPDAPRSTEDLTKIYQDLAARAAQSQYLVYVHTKNLTELNEQMIGVNREASERDRLDKQAAQTKSAEVQDVKA